MWYIIDNMFWKCDSGKTVALLPGTVHELEASISGAQTAQKLHCTKLTRLFCRNHKTLRHRRLRLLLSFISFNHTERCALITQAVIKARGMNSQLHTYFQQLLQLEGARMKFKGYLSLKRDGQAGVKIRKTRRERTMSTWPSAILVYLCLSWRHPNNTALGHISFSKRRHNLFDSQFLENLRFIFIWQKTKL